MLSTNDKMHWAQKRRILAPWRDAVGWAWKTLPQATRVVATNVPARVQVTIGFRTAAHRDPANYVGTIVKALVDQLVIQGCWPDDGPEWVTVDEPICVKGDTITVRLVPRG